jgi:hypothetical protein
MGRVALRPVGRRRHRALLLPRRRARAPPRARRHQHLDDRDHLPRATQGAQGLVAGRFDAGASVETVAVYGYAGRVVLLSRRATGWQVETLFRDRDKGHWLAVAELDGRNSTDEIVASGYGARIVLLARPVGYGRTEAVDPAARR